MFLWGYGQLLVLNESFTVLSCLSWVDIIKIALYVLYWAKISDDDGDYSVS